MTIEEVYALYHKLYAEATAIPYDVTRLDTTEECLFEIAEAFNLNSWEIKSEITVNYPEQSIAARKLLAKSESVVSASVMGTVSKFLADFASHFGYDIEAGEEFDKDLLLNDIIVFANVLRVIDEYYHLRENKVVH